MATKGGGGVKNFKKVAMWFVHDLFASVLFPAVTIKMSNFSTCFITSTPIKRYYDSYKLISLTGMKTRCDFLENIFAIFTFFQDSSFVLFCSAGRPRQKTLNALFSSHRFDEQTREG